MNSFLSLSLADLHCDTAYELFRQKKHMGDPTLAVDFDSSPYRTYLQAMAVWSDFRLSDEEAYRRFFEIAGYLRAEEEGFLKAHPECRTFLCVEDARILAGHPERIRTLFDAGVRLLTLTWKGESCIGGAYDTEAGLTGFGRQVVRDCFSMGILPDVSHASIKSFYEVAELADGLPFVASHSDAYAVCPHPRNLRDEQFAKIRECGGLVGINLCVEHLGCDDKKNGIACVLLHIEHFLSLGGENTLCFGCDFDGAETPQELRHPSGLAKLAGEMQKIGYPQSLIEKIFWRNAESFLQKNIHFKSENFTGPGPGDP